MKWIVYLTVCLSNLKIYIGYHKTENPDVFDGYLGCGVYIQRPSSYKKSCTPFQLAVNKYGTANFKRITLAVVDSEEEAKKLETLLVDEDFIRRKDTYNIKLGGDGGCPDTWFVKIYMYDLDGNFVMEFESAFACNKFFNKKAKNGSSVLKALKTGQILHNYQFSNKKVDHMKKWEPKKGSHNFKRRVGQYDENGNLIKEYESTLAAKKAGFQNIAKALKYPERKCKGYFFKYLD